jgi:hypothetical protein
VIRGVVWDRIDLAALPRSYGTAHGINPGDTNRAGNRVKIGIANQSPNPPYYKHPIAAIQTAMG